MININTQLPQLDTVGSLAVKASSPIRSALKTIFIIIAAPLASFIAVFSCLTIVDLVSKRNNIICLSDEELEDLRKFIEKENINTNENKESNVSPWVDGRYFIDSPKLFSAYVKYLVKNSTDHELKNIPSKDIVIFTISSEYEGTLDCILKLAKESGKPIPGISSNVACRNLKSALSVFNRVPAKELKQEVCLLDKSEIIDCLKADAAQKFGRDAVIIDMGIPFSENHYWHAADKKMGSLETKWYVFAGQDFAAIPADQAEEYNKIVSEFKASKRK